MRNINLPVSIVMPSLNQVQFLEVAVRSVLEQDYPHVELIVADGMSTDGSLELLMQLQAEYGERLRWSSQQDGGAAEALNHAIAQAHGDVVGWLNSDDMYTQGAVARAMAHFAKHTNHHMVYGEVQHINEAGEALAQVGELDATIKTAFDFDLFVRFFKRYPRQIGMVRRVQAYSRLHAACMTQRLRRQVALDGMRVKAKELGAVAANWFPITNFICPVPKCSVNCYA